MNKREKDFLMNAYRDNEDAIAALPERWRTFVPILNTYVQIAFDYINMDLSGSEDEVLNAKLSIINFVLNNLGFEIVKVGRVVAVCPMSKRNMAKQVGRRSGQRKNA